jgi:hypothetical protein
MAGKRGKDFKLYRNTDDPYDNTPTWVECKNVKDLKRGVEKALADASTRESDWRMQVGTLKELTVDFGMVYNPTDIHLQAFENAFYKDTDVELLILDGPIGTVGSKGIRFMSQVTKFPVDEALEDMGRIDVTVVPSYAPDNPPRRVSVVTPGSVTDTP